MVGLFIGCKGDRRTSLLIQPSSGGRTYEVLVTGPNWSAVEATAQVLRDIKMEGLPQEEEAFDVSTIVEPELNQGTRYARNLIVVSTDSTRQTETNATFEFDTYAHPQLIIHINAATTAQLKQWLADNKQAIADQLTRAEMNNGIVNLREHHNAEAEKKVEEMFRCRLWVPEDLNKMKQGNDFLWFSNDGTSGMLNICIYRYPATELTPELMLHKRDSVMQNNIEGEDENMRMTTVLRSVSFHKRNEETTEILGSRGLWEMQGDDMGGPFVSMARQEGDSVICIEGFVYAPGMNKRNLIRRLEAALYTMKI